MSRNMRTDPLPPYRPTIFRRWSLLFIWFSITFLAGPLFARKAELAVLPFRVTGRPDPSLFSESEIPFLMQDATHFLFSTMKEYRLQSVPETNGALERASFKPDQVLDAPKGRRLCMETDASYLLAGEIQFLDGDRILVMGSSYSCGSGSVLARDQSAGDLNDLQGILRRVIARTVPFAGNKAARTYTGKAVLRPVDLGVVLDLSGSMAVDFPVIRRSLSAIMERLPAGSRLGMVLLKEGDAIDPLPFSTDWKRWIERLQGEGVRGEVSLEGLERGLEEIERFRDWKGIQKLLVFSDAPTKGKRADRLDSRLRRLKSRGVEIHLMQLYGQRQDGRQEWERLARTIGLDSPVVYYGRRVGFLQGFSIFMLQAGSRFYRADTDIGASLQEQKLDLDTIPELSTVAFDRSDLNLDALPYQYAKVERLKVVGLGPLVSGLESKIADAALSGTTEESAPYRALVKNGNISFWINVGDAGTARTLQNLTGETLYLGLHFRPGATATEPITNLPDPIYVRKQGEVPRLLINNRAHLVRLPAKSVRPGDVWFLLVRIEEVKDASGSRDIRE